MATKSLVYVIEGLELGASLDFGHVRLYEREAGRERLRKLATLEKNIDFVRTNIESKIDELITVAEIDLVALQTDDDQKATEHLREVVDVLTTLCLRGVRSSVIGLFGLPGDLVRARVDALHVREVDGQSDHVVFGARNAGHYTGFEMTADGVRGLTESREYKFMHRVLGSRNRRRGEQRAVRGCKYFAKSVRERDDGIAMLLAAGAIEAWIVPERAQGTSYEFARAVAWFSCFPPAMCGRDRNPCPYLLLHPGEDGMRLRNLSDLSKRRAKKMRRDPTTAVDGWTCSMWTMGVDWYKHRSDVAHGGERKALEKERQNQRFWIATYLVDGILSWIEDHPAKPAEDLREHLGGLERPADWDTVVDLIDREDFSRPCPYQP